MKRLKLDEIDLSVDAFSIQRLSRGIKTSGFFMPTRREMGPCFVSGEDEFMTLLVLEGQKPFRYFNLQLGSPIEGLLFTEFRVGVSLASRLNPQSDGQLGDLTLSFDKVNVLAADSGDGFSDPNPFPLGVPAKAPSETPIAFRKWSVFIEDRGREIELWHHDGHPAHDDKKGV